MSQDCQFLAYQSFVGGYIFLAGSSWKEWTGRGPREARGVSEEGYGRLFVRDYEALCEHLEYRAIVCVCISLQKHRRSCLVPPLQLPHLHLFKCLDDSRFVFSCTVARAFSYFSGKNTVD